MMNAARPLRASTRLDRGILAVALLSTSSCNPSQVSTRIPEDHARLESIVTVYAYACRDLGRPPESVDDLTPIFKKANVADPQAYLTSTRDGQPYVIVWGIDLESRDLNSAIPLAYEQVGKDGKRLVVTCNQQVQEFSETEFAQIAWPDGHEVTASP